MDHTDLPYGEETFQKACKKLFQHRTVTHTLPRDSTAVFNSRSVYWGSGSPGKSMGKCDLGFKIENMQYSC